MGGRLVPFPADLVPERSLPGPGRREVAEVRIAVRRLKRGSSSTGSTRWRLPRWLTFLEEAQSLRVAGLPHRLVIEASYRGPSAGLRAAIAIAQTADAVRRGRRFVPAGSVAVGTEVSAGGVTVRTGDPGETADRLCARAAPGQILVAGAGWGSMDGIDARPVRTGVGGSEPVFTLRDAREPAGYA